MTADPHFIGSTIAGATISPDGSRVVFVGGTGELLAVDADGGPAEVLAESREGNVKDPTFSPDGTRIAYTDGGGDHSHHVWVMGADGSDAHEIVFNEWTDTVGHVYGLDWSPAGDRIALGLEGTTYTFAPDGSDFKRVITHGDFPYWSPDGSQIAYTIDCFEDPDGCGLAIADADGSNAQTFDFATSGPWHPAPIPSTEPPSVPTDDVAPTPGPGTLAYGVDGDIFLADADGSNAVRIADGVPVDGADECAPGEERAEYAVFGTAWSPDGRYLAYWDWGCPVPPGAWGTVLISDAEGNVITSFPGQAWTISWSPDSTRVAVMDVWGLEDATIGVYGLDGIRQVALSVPSALTPSMDYSPVWSRDGSSILLPGVQVPLNGDAPTPLEPGFSGFEVYSPDGSRVAYVGHGSFDVDDADGSDAQKAGGPAEFWDLAWSPNGDLVAFVVDGRAPRGGRRDRSRHVARRRDPVGARHRVLPRRRADPLHAVGCRQQPELALEHQHGRLRPPPPPRRDRLGGSAAAGWAVMRRAYAFGSGLCLRPVGRARRMHLEPRRRGDGDVGRAIGLPRRITHPDRGGAGLPDRGVRRHQRRTRSPRRRRPDSKRS